MNNCSAQLVRSTHRLCVCRNIRRLDWTLFFFFYLYPLIAAKNRTVIRRFPSTYPLKYTLVTRAIKDNYEVRISRQFRRPKLASPSYIYAALVKDSRVAAIPNRCAFKLCKKRTTTIVLNSQCIAGSVSWIVMADKQLRYDMPSRRIVHSLSLWYYCNS